jgi:NADH-quinone oxidoreductase subunit N
MLANALNAIRVFMHGDGATLLPELELLLFAAGILAMDLWISYKEKYWSPALALAGTGFSSLTLWMLRGRIAQSGVLTGFHETIIVDSYFIFFSALFLVATTLVILLSMRSAGGSAALGGRYYAFLLLACTGMMLMLSAIDLAIIFVSMEAAGISFYFLTCFPTLAKKPSPSAIKFFLSSALGSALIAYGFSIVYGLSASTSIMQIGGVLARRHNVAKVIALSRQPGERSLQMLQLLQTRLPEALHWRPTIVQFLPIVALLLMLVGFWRKIKSPAAQHRDAGAAAAIALPVSLFLSGALVIATFALFMRLLLTIFGDLQNTWWYLIAAMSIALLVGQTLFALFQKNLVRILIHSCIAQIGIISLGLVAANEAALTDIAYYLFIYLFMLTGAFTVLLALQRRHLPSAAAHRQAESHHAQVVENLSDLDGLRRHSPITALLLIIFVLALAGFPPTAGFFGHLFIARALLETGHPVLAWFSAFLSLPLALSYFRIAVHAWRSNSTESHHRSVSFDLGQAIALGVCLFVSLAAGLYAEPFTRLARYAFGQ